MLVEYLRDSNGMSDIELTHEIAQSVRLCNRSFMRTLCGEHNAKLSLRAQLRGHAKSSLASPTILYMSYELRTSRSINFVACTFLGEMSNCSS